MEDLPFSTVIPRNCLNWYYLHHIFPQPKFLTLLLSEIVFCHRGPTLVSLETFLLFDRPSVSWSALCDLGDQLPISEGAIEEIRLPKAPAFALLR